MEEGVDSVGSWVVLRLDVVVGGYVVYVGADVAGMKRDCMGGRFVTWSVCCCCASGDGVRVTMGMVCCCCSSGDGAKVITGGTVCCCCAGGVKVMGGGRVVCVSSCRSSGLGVLRFVSSRWGVLSSSYSAVIVDDVVDAGECVWLVESKVMNP